MCSPRRAKIPIIYPDLRLDYKVATHPAYERPVGDSWRVDETYLKVGGQWVYLYRSVDKQGKTVESYLSRTRDVTAAKTKGNLSKVH